MPRMKLDDDEFNVKELDVEYEGGQFERYTGDVPKTGTKLIARVTKMWWTRNNDDDAWMIKLIAVAERNTGKLAEFNGLPAWDYLAFKPTGAFRYQPFLYNFDLSVADVKKKMIVADTDDNVGTPIEAIADWEVNSDDALCQIVIKRDPYEGEIRAKIDVDGWLPYEADESDDDDEEDEEDEPEPPARSRRSKTAAAKTAKAAPKSRRRAEPEPEDDDDDEYDDDDDEPDDDDPDEDEPEPPRSRRAAPARSTRPATRANGAGTRRAATREPARAGSSRRAKGSKDDPPF